MYSCSMSNRNYLIQHFLPFSLPKGARNRLANLSVTPVLCYTPITDTPIFGLTIKTELFTSAEITEDVGLLHINSAMHVMESNHMIYSWDVYTAGITVVLRRRQGKEWYSYTTYCSGLSYGTAAISPAWNLVCYCQWVEELRHVLRRRFLLSWHGTSAPIVRRNSWYRREQFSYWILFLVSAILKTPELKSELPWRWWCCLVRFYWF